MSRIKRDELFQHVSCFLKARGIELSSGAYSDRIRAGCSLLTDAANMTQAAVAKAKTGVDARFERVRQAIHEKTAPKAATAPPPTPGKAKAPRVKVAQPSSPKAGAKPSRARKAK